MAEATATFEAGVNGNTITNAGGEAALSAWNTVTIAGAGNTLVYSNAQFKGTLSAKVDAATTPASGVTMQWSTAIGTLTDHYGRIYLYCPANPSGTIRLINDSAGSNKLRLTSTGMLSVFDAGGQDIITTTAIALNQWVRIEWHTVQSATVGQHEIKLFNDAESSTPTQTVTGTANRNNAASITSMTFGNNSGASHAVVFHLDNIVAGAVAYPGPSLGSGGGAAFSGCLLPSAIC
jgi:hypothetical protein